MLPVYIGTTTYDTGIVRTAQVRISGDTRRKREEQKTMGAILKQCCVGIITTLYNYCVLRNIGIDQSADDNVTCHLAQKLKQSVITSTQVFVSQSPK